MRCRMKLLMKQSIWVYSTGYSIIYLWAIRCHRVHIRTGGAHFLTNVPLLFLFEKDLTSRTMCGYRKFYFLSTDITMDLFFHCYNDFIIWLRLPHVSILFFRHYDGLKFSLLRDIFIYAYTHILYGAGNKKISPSTSIYITKGSMYPPIFSWHICTDIKNIKKTY